MAACFCCQKNTPEVPLLFADVYNSYDVRALHVLIILVPWYLNRQIVTAALNIESSWVALLKWHLISRMVKWYSHVIWCPSLDVVTHRHREHPSRELPHANLWEVEYGHITHTSCADTVTNECTQGRLTLSAGELLKTAACFRGK